MQLAERNQYGVETRDTNTYRALLDPDIQYTPGVVTPLEFTIVDQFGNPYANFDMSYSGKFLNYGYAAVASRDLSSLQTSSLLIDPYLAYGRAAGGFGGDSGGGSGGMGGGMGGSGGAAPQAQSSSSGENPALAFQERKIVPKFIFPKEGQYTLFVQFWPRGGDMQILSIPINVGSAKSPPADLAQAAPLTQSIGDLKVTLNTDGPLKAGQYHYLDFDIVDGSGAPQMEAISMLSGDYCNLYILDENLKTLIKPDFIKRSDLLFSVNFPEPGKYKVWFEFVYANRLQQVAYIVDVQ